MIGGGLFQPWHLIVILVLIVVFFGPSRLPRLGQSLGKSIRDFRSSISGADDDHSDGGKKA